jgi:hypothetical protein
MQNVGADKISMATKYWHRQKLLVSTKFSQQQNSLDNKILVPTKFSRRQKSRVDKNLALTMFGTAESTAADFSQTSLKISFISQIVLITCSRQVWHCLWPPCFYGRTISRTVLAYCTGPLCWKRHKFWRRENIGVRLKFTDFCQTIAVYVYICSQVSYQKVVKTKSDHHHCPISVIYSRLQNKRLS